MTNTIEMTYTGTISLLLSRLFLLCEFVVSIECASEVLWVVVSV